VKEARKYRVLILLALVVLLGAGMRIVHLGADSPTTFPNGYSSTAPVKDEAAKCFAARNKALFGSFTTRPADDYRYWEILSPFWTWTMYGWLKLAGVSYERARMAAVMWSVLTIVLAYLILADKDRRAALFSAALFAVNFYAVVFGRLALLETPVNALLLLAFAFQARAVKNPLMLAPASAAWLCAWLTKQSAAVYLPVLVLGGLYVLLYAQDSDGKRRALGAAFVALAIIAAGLCFASWDYRLRTVMNFRHAMDFQPDPSYLWMRVSLQRTLSAVADNLSVDLVRGYLAMMPVAAPLALMEAVLIGWALLRRKEADALSVFALAWWLAARVVLTLQGQKFVRFYLIEVPPSVILAGLAAARLMVYQRSRSRLASAALIGMLAAGAACHLVPWGLWVLESPREIERAGRQLGALIGERPAAVVGEWAGPLTFETGYKSYYLKSVFNRTSEHASALGITHLLETKRGVEGAETDPAARRIIKFFPSAYDDKKKLGEIVMWEGEDREAVLSLYEISLEAAP